MCVESVAWISEQKTALSTVFYLLAALTYLRFRENPASRMGASGQATPGAVSGPRPSTFGLYWLAMLFFILALWSKSVTATLPAALLVIFWWRNGRLSLKRDVLPLLPWFAVALSAGLFTAWVERRIIGATGETFDLSFVQRCWLAGRVTWFYLAKLAWPSNLIFFYPHWEVKAWPAWASLYPLAVAALMAGLWLFRRRSRGPLAGLMFYVGSLFPALGFFNVYPFVYSYVADHFQYLATFGVVALAAAGWAWWDSWSVEARRQIAGPQPSGFSKLRRLRVCGRRPPDRRRRRDLRVGNSDLAAVPALSRSSHPLPGDARAKSGFLDGPQQFRFFPGRSRPFPRSDHAISGGVAPEAGLRPGALQPGQRAGQDPRPRARCDRPLRSGAALPARQRRGAL